MGTKRRPKLVQFASLIAAHFIEHPVWAACHVTDYDEPWYDDTDEETFRPWYGDLPVDPESSMFLVRARFITRDGVELSGFVTPVREDSNDDMRSSQPHVFLPSGKIVGFWLGMMVDQGPGKRAALTTELQKDASAIFPIRFTVEDGLTTGLQAGEVQGFAGLD
jgi:hypothetical protein